MPTRNRTPHGRAWKPPRHTCSADIRPRGQQGAARRCAAVPESREARSAPGSPRETEAGSSRQKGWTNRGVSPAGRHPLLSRPHHARIVHEPAQPRRSPCATPIEVGGQGPRGMRFGRSPRLRAGERRPLRGRCVSFLEVQTYSAGPRDLPHYRRRRLRLGARWAPESVPRWGHAVRLAVPAPRVAQSPATPPPILVVESLQPRVSRRRRVAASARAPQPAHPRLQPLAARARPDPPVCRAQLPIP